MITAVLLGAGCTPQEGTIETPAPPIDFAKAARLAQMLFDLSNNANISDAELVQRYQTPDNEVLVVSAVFPGDTLPSRYMFIKDHAASTQTVYLSGTNTGALWRFDFDLETYYELDFHASVHRGFNNAALTVMDDLLPRLELDYTTTITGYSLGGAMAVLLSQYLILDGYTVNDVVTFGQPQITGASGVTDFLDLPLLRFVNRNDPVPRLPPNGFTGPEDFVPFGPEVILYDGPYYAYMTEDNPYYYIANDGNLWNILLTTNVNEHGYYPDRLQSKVDQAIQIPYVVQAPSGP
jgi:hypothetical protein